MARWRGVPLAPVPPSRSPVQRKVLPSPPAIGRYPLPQAGEEVPTEAQGRTAPLALCSLHRASVCCGRVAHDTHPAIPRQTSMARASEPPRTFPSTMTHFPVRFASSVVHTFRNVFRRLSEISQSLSPRRPPLVE